MDLHLYVNDIQACEKGRGKLISSTLVLQESYNTLFVFVITETVNTLNIFIKMVTNSNPVMHTYKLLQHTEGQLSNLNTLQLTESFQPYKSTIYNAPQIFHKNTSILESKLSSVAVKPRNVIVMEHR